MKLEITNSITIFINNYYIKKIDISKEENIKKLINNINLKYSLKLEGYLKISIYKDKNYGIIINIEKEDIEYFDCFNLDIKSDIEIINQEFLYKIEDIFSIKDLKKYIIYKNKDEIYLKIQDESYINVGKIIENSTIIYGKKLDTIKKQIKKIKPEVISCTQ